MKMLKKLWLFPRSLRQLVILAFLLVLLPLLILAYQAYLSLNKLSAQVAESNKTTLMDVRRSETMVSTALEMERSYRQFCVVGGETLHKLYQKQRRAYIQMLTVQSTVLSDKKLYQTLNGLLQKLEKMNCASGEPVADAVNVLESFSTANSEMVHITRNVIFSRGELLQRDIASRGQFFGWQSLTLFLISLLLVFLFTRMIIGPVKHIERMINRLGEGKALGEYEGIHGPNELKSLAQRIVWLNERLAWLESQRHEFLRHISHELKTPLASMREGTELLADGVAGELTKEQREVVSILDGSSRHLQQLIEQLLDYNRYLADTSARLQQVDINQLVSDTIIAHSLLAKSKSMATQCQLESSVCWAEETLLGRVLDNLYSNAVHYGEESGNIWISSRQIADFLQIDIANSGEPLSSAEQEMVFEPFYQGSRQRKGAVKGSGLGLSIARNCVQQMQGSLTLINVDYADVCFRIELPLKQSKRE